MSAFGSYKERARSMFTYVTQTGITLSVTGAGLLLGGSRLLTKGQVDRLVSGTLLVSTPHRAGGVFSERRIGGVYPVVKAKARWLTLGQWIAADPRATEDDKAAAIAAINQAYGVNLAAA